MTDEATEPNDCPVCRGSGPLRHPLLLLALVGVLALWFRDVESRTEMKRTDAEFDVAIRGHGHFQILQPDGTFAYTRFGRFSLNEQRQLVTAEGYQIQPLISVPADAKSVTIGTDGSVSIAHGNAATLVGNLSVALFSDPDSLSEIEPGRPYYQATSESGDPIVLSPGTQGVGKLHQGWLEGSAWFADASLLRIAIGLGVVLLAGMLSELRRQRRHVARLDDRLSRLTVVNSPSMHRAA